MQKNQYIVPILPFDELVKLHQQGLLDDYAEQKTRELISKCNANQERAIRLETLAFKLSAIRARQSAGLKGYLEIDQLLRDCQFEFHDRLKQAIQGRSLEEENAKDSQTAKVLAFPEPTRTNTKL